MACFVEHILSSMIRHYTRSRQVLAEFPNIMHQSEGHTVVPDPSGSAAVHTPPA